MSIFLETQQFLQGAERKQMGLKQRLSADCGKRDLD
jgi:hypothetical protein